MSDNDIIHEVVSVQHNWLWKFRIQMLKVKVKFMT